MDVLETLLRDTLADASREAPAPRGVPAYQDPEPRRRGVILAIAAAVVAIAVGAATIGLDHRGDSAPAQGSFANNLVGFGKVAIPLPNGWGLNRIDVCGTPKSNTVLVPQPAEITDGCLTVKDPAVSFILLDSLRGSTASQWRGTATEPFRLADGIRALYGSTTTHGEVPGAGAVTFQFVRVVVVPSLDVIALGVGPRDGALDGPLSQIAPIPSNGVVVPEVGSRWPAAAARLTSLGLSPQEKVAKFAHYPPGLVYGTTPAASTIVARGSTVIVNVSG